MTDGVVYTTLFLFMVLVQVVSKMRFPCLHFWFSAAAASAVESVSAVEIDVDFDSDFHKSNLAKVSSELSQSD